jgi:type IV secretory pathway TraG/TraD family ATPase VirD4
MISKGVSYGFDNKGQPIVCDGNLPTLIVGAMGSNKTVGHVAFQLLDDDSGKRSQIVLDPKGEVCSITCEYRRKVCGKDNVKIINPYGLLVKERPDMKSDGWNPLAHLNPDAPSYGDDCAAVGNAVIEVKSNESQPIFPKGARSAFTAGVNFEVREARRQNLPPSLANVRAVWALETAQLVEVIKKMIATGDPDIVTRVRKFFNDNTEIQNLKSNIETETAWQTKPMRDDMCVKDGVDFSACKKRATTIYIIIPIEELKPAYSPDKRLRDRSE